MPLHNYMMHNIAICNTLRTECTTGNNSASQKNYSTKHSNSHLMSV